MEVNILPKKRKLPAWMSKKEHAANMTEGETPSQSQMQKQPKLEGRGPQPSPIHMPLLKYPGSITYSCHKEDASILAEQIRSTIPEDGHLDVGFDIEWPITYEKGGLPKTALLQLCTSEKDCYLFHLTYINGIPKALKILLEDKRLIKAGVGIEGDLWKLDKDYDLQARKVIRESMADLSPLANKILKTSQNWSLDGLTQHLLSKSLSKADGVRTSDWAQYPLTEEQKTYAATDAYASLILYQELKKRQVESVR